MDFMSDLPLPQGHRMRSSRECRSSAPRSPSVHKGSDARTGFGEYSGWVLGHV